MSKPLNLLANDDSTVAADRAQKQCILGATVPHGFSVADLCRRWKVGPDKIHAFLRRGELIGLNIASSLSARPQWRVTPESVALFERRRSSAPPQKAVRRRRQIALKDYYP